MFKAEIEYRLKYVFQSDLFAKSTTDFSFLEDSDDGKMALELIINHPSLCIMNLDKQNPIPFLNLKRGFYARRADYALFEFISDNTCRLHIFEMTTTVNQGKWENKIKQQLKSAYVYCMAVAACLEMEVEDVLLYTIYANDNFAGRVAAEDDHSTALLKPPLGGYRPNPQEEWATNIVKFDFGQWRAFKHEKINVIRQQELYPTGTYTIR